ncbi:MAG: nucleotidyltransferase family protein [Akkermansiaceae bacterium]
MHEQTLAPIKDELLACGVQSLGLFGSFVRGEMTAISDVDVLITFLPGRKTYDNFERVYDALKSLFGRKIDLVTEESLSPHFGPEIKRTVEYVSLV